MGPDSGLKVELLTIDFTPLPPGNVTVPPLLEMVGVPLFVGSYRQPVGGVLTVANCSLNAGFEGLLDARPKAGSITL